ncbi:hypothetical protein niasHT_021913 [Heterodera trifolii]|uniref:FHA domain-containing protein n=1 Tax=Heterodera trifolii TaxID=157864 RepID=A0ABD2KC64_9BILA
MAATQTMDNEKTLQGEGIFAEPVLPQKNMPLKPAKSEESDEGTETEQNQQQPTISDLRYQQPFWALVPAEDKQEYFLEIIKEGTVIGTVRLHDSAHQKSFWSIGRFEPCDIKLEHPSVSRFHAILQYGECVKGRPGWFIFDMNSTHGVRLNKQPLKKRTYVPLHNGFVFQIAGSSRLFTVCGGPKSEQKEEENKEKAQPMGKTENKKDGEEEGEGEEEQQLRYYEKDPLGWLQKYFEREGLPMHFQFTKSSSDGGGGGAGDLLAEFEDEQNKKRGRRHSDEGHWTCSIELVSDVSLTSGNVVTVSAPSKRLAQLQCSLVACERLNDACLLRISSLWNKRKNYTENDFYDSDEDTFLDRTGQIEEQREKRRKRFGTDIFASSGGHAKNYAELIKELAETEAKLGVVRQEMQRLLQKDKVREEQQGEEQQPKQMNFSTRMALSQLKGKEKKLLDEKTKLEKLSEIARPSHRLMPILLQRQPEIVVKKEAEETVLDGGENEKEVKRETVENEEGEKEAAEKQPKEETEKGRETQAEAQTSATQHTVSERENDEREKRVDESRNEATTSIPSPKTAEERFYAPALPPKRNEMAEAIVPKFGMLTKEEMARMKMLQQQMERKPELAAAVKRARLEQEQKTLKTDEEGNQQMQDVREKYTTWLPPEDQSGDGFDYTKFGLETGPDRPRDWLEGIP